MGLEVGISLFGLAGSFQGMGDTMGLLMYIWHCMIRYVIDLSMLYGVQLQQWHSLLILAHHYPYKRYPLVACRSFETPDGPSFICLSLRIDKGRFPWEESKT